MQIERERPDEIRSIDLIVDKGQILGGILAIALILGAAIALVLAFYRQVLIDAAEKPRRPAPESPLPEAKTHRLTESTFEPIPSITESTTELLVKKK